jgi:hypothetical protein
LPGLLLVANAGEADKATVLVARIILDNENFGGGVWYLLGTLG